MTKIDVVKFGISLAHVLFNERILIFITEIVVISELKKKRNKTKLNLYKLRKKALHKPPL